MVLIDSKLNKARRASKNHGCRLTLKAPQRVAIIDQPFFVSKVIQTACSGAGYFMIG